MHSNSSRQTRFVIVGPMHPYRGGIAHFSETLYHGLEAREHDVRGVTFSRQYPELFFPGKTQYVAQDVPPSVQADRLIDSMNPISWLQTARQVAAGRPDLVVFNYWMPYLAPAFGTIARWLRWKGIRVAAVVHNALPHERRAGDRLLARFFLEACSELITLSGAVADDLEQIGIESPVELVHHPIYDKFGEVLPRGKARRRLDLAESAPLLLFFGFIRRYKGLHILLEAMPHIVERLPEVRLIVAGEFYDERSFYEKIIKQHRLEPYIRLETRYIPDEDVAVYFSAADLVVQPYLSATQSGVAQIAFQFERPLVVTDVGGLPEVVPHERAGLIVPPEQPQQLARAVVRFFQDDLQDELTEGVRTEKKKYSWEPLYRKLEGAATPVSSE